MSLKPDYIFSSAYDITPEFLHSIGISTVISDIDNTLITYDDEAPTQQCICWLDEMRASGIKISFLSNNTTDRVDVFNKDLSLPAIGKGAKPLPCKAKKLFEQLNTDKTACVFLGDQIFTDVICGKLLGVRTVLVPPIKDKKDPFTRFKRVLEGLILNKKHDFNK